MKIRRILIIALVVTLVCAAYVFACGDGSPFNDAKECYIVVVETEVGSRCGHIYHYGVWHSDRDAEAWAKVNAPKPTETTYVTVRRVEIVTQQQEK